MDKLKECLEALASEDPEIRRNAIYGLRHTEKKASTQAIIARLDDPSSRVHTAAAWALVWRPRAVEAIPKLISLLKSSPPSRTPALFALSEMKASEAVEAIIELLSIDGNRTRSEAARALGQIGDPRAFEPLVDALKRAGSPEDRESIWYAIGAIGCADKVRHLSYLMETPNWKVRPEDRRAMLEPPERPVRRLYPKEIAKIKADIGEIASADMKVRDRAVVRLGRRRGQAVELLAEATASPNVEMRFGALFALEAIRDPRAYPVVLELTKDPVDDLRWWALHILGKLGGERAIPVLIKALHNEEDTYGNSGAADGLIAVGKPAVPVLIQMLETGNDDQQISASWVLRRIGDERAIPHIAKLLHNPNPQVRISGIEDLWLIAEEKPDTVKQQCIKLIEPALEDPDEKVRETARYSIENIRNPNGGG